MKCNKSEIRFRQMTKPCGKGLFGGEVLREKVLTSSGGYADKVFCFAYAQV